MSDRRDGGGKSHEGEHDGRGPALDRRTFLRGTVGLTAACGLAPWIGPLVGCDSSDDRGPDPSPYTYDGPLGPSHLFQHGVASGDPLADAVILWTRVTPGDDGAEVSVFWEIMGDVDLTDRVAWGELTTDADRDYTVKVDVGGLDPGRTYYYRFRAMGRASPLGRTRTLPVGEVDRVRLAVVSCADYSKGWFHTFRQLAVRPDLDAVLHLGDYIYEKAATGGTPEQPRAMDPEHRCETLSDYRRRYAHYRRDADLQAVHRQHPMIAVWDDHEFTNNAWRDGPEGDAAELAWVDRQAAGERAWREWLPVRDHPDGHIYRAFEFGDLVDLCMLDTRIVGRDEQAKGVYADDIRREPDRQILGETQEAWLLDRLRSSRARWQLLGQQVMFGQLNGVAAPLSEGGGRAINMDQWDGYVPARQRIFDAVREEGLKGFAVVTGDIHSSWALDLTDDPNNPEAYDPSDGAGALGAEFVAPAVTSFAPSFIQPAVIDALRVVNPHQRWIDLEYRGYIIVDVDRERMQAAWFHFDRIDIPDGVRHQVAKVFALRHGRPGIVEQDEPAKAPAGAPLLASDAMTADSTPPVDA